MNNYFNSTAFNVWNGPQSNPDAIIARDVRVGDVIVNTECTEEIDIDTQFVVMNIKQVSGRFHSLEFTVRLDDGSTVVLHYAAQEPVGILL